MNVTYVVSKGETQGEQQLPENSSYLVHGNEGGDAMNDILASPTGLSLPFSLSSLFVCVCVRAWCVCPEEWIVLLMLGWESNSDT